MKTLYALAVFVAYYLTARLGLSINAVSEFASAVWPPTGIAIAAILLGGPSMAVAVMAAAFAVNYEIGESLQVATGIAVGNTLEALVAANLINRIKDFDWTFGHIHHVMRFISDVVIASTLVSAVIGTTVILIAGKLAPQEIANTLITWWLGDALGALIVTPFIMAWSKYSIKSLIQKKTWEFATLLTIAVLTCSYLFIDLDLWQFWNVIEFRRVYLIFPLIIWSALRFGSIGVASLMIIVSAFSSFGATTHSFIFRSTHANESLHAVQIFIGISALTGVIIAAAVKQFQISESKFRAMFEMTGVAMVQTDLQGRFILINDQFCSMTGYSREDLMGSTFSLITHPDDIAPNAVLFERLITGKDKYLHFEKRYIKKDGQIIWVIVDSTLLSDETTGKSSSTIAVLQDITTRKIAELSAESALKQAEDANRAKSAFLASMSHEIRTPLGVILGFSELLRDQDLPSETRSEFNETVFRNAQELGRLIDDILDLSKVEAGRLDVAREPIRLNVLLNDIRDTFSASAKAKNLSLGMSVDENVPDEIASDQKRLRQILINIVGNAVKFTAHGHIQINVALTKSTPEANDLLTFEVSDTGCGISKEDAAILFQPFTQAKKAAVQNIRGTGLGLVLSRHLAKLLGGDVCLKESLPNVGSTFVVTVNPGAMAKKKSISPAKKTNSDNLRLDGVKILVAEDTPDQSILINYLLSDLGAKVEMVENGALAVDKALSDTFDVILMDMQMPILNGYEATQRLRNEGYNGPIIALTAQAMSEDPKKCRDAGCSDHLAKPFSQDSLRLKIREYLTATS